MSFHLEAYIGTNKDILTAKLAINMATPAARACNIERRLSDGLIPLLDFARCNISGVTQVPCLG